MNTYLKYQPPAVQFLAFLAMAGGFIILNSVISTWFFSDVNAVVLNKNAAITPEVISKFKIAQVASAIISFLLPALLFAYYSSPAALPYVGLQKVISPVLVLIAIILLVSVQPFIGYLGYKNAHFNFGSYQKLIEQTEAVYTRVLKAFLQMNGTGDLLMNVFIMAILPAIAEELFFRGAMQKALLRLSNKPWLAIFLSALIFALLHGTFLKILPIFTLGLMLGIIYHYTRNLWYTIIMHFLNNTFALLTVYFADSSNFLKKIADDNIAVPVYAAIVSLFIAIGFIFLMKKESDKVFPKELTNEENDYIV